MIINYYFYSIIIFFLKRKFLGKFILKSSYIIIILHFHIIHAQTHKKIYN